MVTLQEAKALLKEDDDLIIAVYDYWLNKRLRMVRFLVCNLKTARLPKEKQKEEKTPVFAARLKIVLVGMLPFQQ